MTTFNLKELTEKERGLTEDPADFRPILTHYEFLPLVTTTPSHNTVDTEGNPAL